MFPTVRDVRGFDAPLSERTYHNAKEGRHTGKLLLHTSA